MPDETPKTYGVFISHASEDKAEVARPLAQELERLGVKVWLDEYELTLGDSLRQEIDRGLTQSRFGVVIFSPDFFRKEWPQRELDALVAIEGARKVILPVWHHLTKDYIVRYSPLLAGKIAVSTERGISYVAGEIVRVLKQDNHRISDQRNERIENLDDIRRRVLVAQSLTQLKQLSYEMEAHLLDHPKDAEAKMLRDSINKAIEKERGRNILYLPDLKGFPIFIIAISAIILLIVFLMIISQVWK